MHPGQDELDRTADRPRTLCPDPLNSSTDQWE